MYSDVNSSDQYKEKPMVHDENPKQKALDEYLKQHPDKKKKPQYYE